MGEYPYVWEKNDVVGIRIMVTAALENELGVTPHRCLVAGLDIDPREIDIHKILSHHGVSSRDKVTYMRHINRDGGAVVLTHGVPGYGVYSDYIVFPGSFGRVALPSVLGEEITHGEHFFWQ